MLHICVIWVHLDSEIKHLENMLQKKMLLGALSKAGPLQEIETLNYPIVVMSNGCSFSAVVGLGDEE